MNDELDPVVLGNLPGNYNWFETLQWTSGIIADGSGSAQTVLEATHRFQVWYMPLFEVFLAADAGSNDQYTPAAFEAGNGTAANVNDFMTRGQFRLEVFVNNNPWQRAPLRASLFTTTAGRLAYLRAPFIIPAGATIKATLYNDGDFTVNAQLCLMGQRLR